MEGTLTGRGAQIIIVDDPIKAGDVKSDADRKRVNDWFQSTLFSRLDDKRTGSIVIAMQRLREDDVTGHLTEDPKNTWPVMTVPAIATEQQTHQLMKRGPLASQARMPGWQRWRCKSHSRHHKDRRSAPVFFPPYSSNLNPIEQTFAKIKHWMRMAQKRTIEEAWRYVGKLVGDIRPAECANYLKNAG